MKENKYSTINIFFLFSMVFLSCSMGNSNECEGNKIGLLKDELSFSTTKEQLKAKGYRDDKNCDCFFKIEQVDKHMTSIFLYLGDDRVDSLICSITYNDEGEDLNKIATLDSIAKRNFYYGGAKVNTEIGAFTRFVLQWDCGI